MLNSGYTEWRGLESDFFARELYDHQSDPLESVNIAGNAENRELIARLSRQLDAGWKAALPDSA